MSEFENSVVWVTGASSGIGEAMVHELAVRGARVVLSARREGALEEVRAAAGLDEARGRVLPVDLADGDALEPTADAAWDAFGHLDVIIHNAGVSQRGRCLHTVLDVDRTIMNVNYLAPVVLTKRIAPRMIARGGGHVVVVSSVLGKISVPGYSGYSASKHALHGFFDALRAEQHDNGLRVTILCVGYVKTNVSINALSEDGTPQGTMDENTEKGLSARECARRSLNAIGKGKNEVLIGGIECQAVRLHRWMPGIFARVARQVARKRGLTGAAPGVHPGTPGEDSACDRSTS